MKKKNYLILAIAVMMMLSCFDCMAFKHFEMELEMEIPEGFEVLEGVGDSTTDFYVNNELGQQIAVVGKLNYKDINYNNLSDNEIKKIENDADELFVPEGSDNYLLSEPVASRVYTDSVDGGTTEGLKIRASYFDTTTNMELYSTVYLFSTDSYYYAVSFLSFDNSEYWYKSCLDSLVIEDKYAKYVSSTDTTTSRDNQKAKSESSSSFSAADFFENIGKILGIALIVYLVYKLLFKNK